MERTPLYDIIQDMKGTDKELNLIIAGEDDPLEIVNVVSVEKLLSSQGLRVTTKQNYIWIDATHVSCAYQVRTDL